VEEQADEQQQLRPREQQHQALGHDPVIPGKIVSETVA
jgi:hypothetical protein